MATRKRAAAGKEPTPPGGDVDLSTHPLVAERNVDPSEIEAAEPETTALVGYVGPSRREGSIRLYQDLTFRNYYEIPSDEVLSTAPVNPDDENSPTVLRVAPETKVEVVTVSVQSVEARYLSGPIAGGFYAAGTGGAAGAQAAAPLCGNITTYMPSCVQQPPCTNITTHMPSCVAQAGAAAAPAGGQTLCTNITTYMPSCVAQQQFCTNITTHMPSCVGGPQQPGPAACGVTLTTMACTFGGGGTVGGGTVVGGTLGQRADTCVFNFTTRGCTIGGTTGFPQPPCANITTHMPSCVHCNPNCIATVVTSGVPGGGGGGGGQVCIDLYTANPSHCAGQCDPNCIATVVTSHAPAAFAARAVQPTPPQYCITRYTANPTDCQPMCLTVVTANPTDCGPICLTVVTANPTDCGGPCLTVVTANPTDCGPKTVVEAARAAPAAAAPQPTPPQFCITLHTHYPSWCDPCRPLVTTAATVCTQVGGPGPCITLHTHYPSWCPPGCQPIANTAATLCTQIRTIPDPGTIICPTVYTARPTGCG